MEKSSKIRRERPKINREYMLLYRLGAILGKETVNSAIAGNHEALAAIEKIAYEPKKKPALIAWLKRQRRRHQ